MYRLDYILRYWILVYV
ncbi:hypothetical protein F383_24424 [Gossypium arboreum]|uniref:Uncharacterized protein n=1 Tax=Gossypium arboreum TaxID=29729 RepID=A0A0B0NFD6_GOSAR|nr:hypothetical protein F383_14315 [Gossypium arboreum]KHG19092.1 hypothetical protein F383_24424 [Gossypium arboreum]